MAHTVYGVWDGGASYAPSDWTADREEFVSITAAKAALQGRYEDGGWQPQGFLFVDGTRRYVTSLCPAVEAEGTRIILFTSVEATEPIAVLTIGPRGGIRQDAA